MNRILPFVLVSLLAATSLMAAERTPAEMQAIAIRQLGMQAASRGQNGSVEAGALVLLRATDTYHIYSSTAGEGFVVVSRDDDFRPVLGYSAETFSESQLPPAFYWWLERIDRSLLWRKSNGQMLQAVSFVPTENFVPTQWGQLYPYYNLCPKSSNVTTVTGCVATAMAQILKYYEYPAKSAGTSYYQLDGETTTYPVQLQTTFDWANMLNKYPTRLSGSATQRTAVAELMRDCGYAAKMVYGTQTSNTHYFNAANGLIDNLGFVKGSIVLADRQYYSDSEWAEIVYAELAAKRPILYSGTDSVSGGHAFLLTGIDNDGLIYVNWGWDGVANGFYDLSDMAPAGIQGWGSSHVDHFNSDITMIYQLTPKPVEEGLPIRLSQFSVYGGKYTLRKYNGTYLVVAFDSNNTYLINNHYIPFQGVIYLHLVNKATNAQRNYTILTTGKDGVSSTIDSYYGYTFSQAVNLSQLPVGTYSACMTSKATGDDSYVPVRSEGGMQMFTVVRTATGITVTEDEVTSDIVRVAAPDSNEPAVRYSLDGRRLPAARRGLNIVRRADGTVVKKMVK